MKKSDSCFDRLSTNGKSPTIASLPPFALSLSKGERRVFQQPVNKVRSGFPRLSEHWMPAYAGMTSFPRKRESRKMRRRHYAHASSNSTRCAQDKLREGPLPHKAHPTLWTLPLGQGMIPNHDRSSRATSPR